MVLSLDELTGRLMKTANLNDALPTDALWIKFVSDGEMSQTVEYRTADENVIVHVYLDKNGALRGIEIFP